MSLSKNQKIGVGVASVGALAFFFLRGDKEENKAGGGGSTGGVSLIDGVIGNVKENSGIKTTTTTTTTTPIDSQGFSEVVASAPTKKSSSSSTASLINQKEITNKKGELVGIQDSILSPNPQSRLPTASEKFAYSVKKQSKTTDSLGQGMSIAPSRAKENTGSTGFFGRLFG